MFATMSCSATMPANASSDAAKGGPALPARPGSRPCRPARASDADVLLPFGQRLDGTIVHVSAVERGLACACVCPGCGGRLVAHKGERKEHHFQHHSSAPCAGAFESALHKLAKQILDRELKLMLPVIEYGEGDDRVVESSGGLFEFDSAEIEVPFPGFQPDVVLHRGERRLLVEVLVTHETDLEKQERIARTGLSAVEIDLSRLAHSADLDQVTEAICRSAPRWWLHNERLTRARERWEAQQAAKARLAAEAAERIRLRKERELEQTAEHLRRALAAPVRERATNPHAAALREAGLVEFANRTIAGEDCFAVPRDVWQGAILVTVILKQLEQHPYAWGQSGVHPLELFRKGPLDPLIKRGIPAGKDEAEALAARVPGFVRPYDVVSSYLDYLALEGLIVAGRNRRWTVTESANEAIGERQAAARRRVDRRAQLTKIVHQIVGSLPEAERKGFALADWLTRPLRLNGLSPADAIVRDGEGDALVSAAEALKTMLSGGGKAQEDPLGLPVRGAMRRELDRRRIAAERAAEETRAREVEAAERAAAAERQAAASRVADLRWRATDGLSGDAAEWLAAPIANENEQTPLALAERDDAGLSRALQHLRSVMDRRADALRTAELRDHLRRIGRESAKPDHAHTFLYSGQPRWQGRRPIDYCTDPTSFETVRRLMMGVTR